ncbi:hypothetical protein IT575_01965 [bacterium]|nr:hypothetical protein [bacterium]
MCSWQQIEAVLAPWRRHEAINQYMLERIPQPGFAAVPLLKSGKPSSGRSVARNWLHLHEVRLSHLRAAEKKLLAALPEFDKGAEPQRAELKAALAASAVAVEARISAALTAGGEGKEGLIRGHPPTVFMAYLISHESHHRGQILLALKQSGFAPSDELKWGIWERWFKD